MFLFEEIQRIQRYAMRQTRQKSFHRRIPLPAPNAALRRWARSNKRFGKLALPDGQRRLRRPIRPEETGKLLFLRRLSFCSSIHFKLLHSNSLQGEVNCTQPCGQFPENAFADAFPSPCPTPPPGGALVGGLFILGGVGGGVRRVVLG